MGRPAKSAQQQNGHVLKEDMETREQAEKKLRGNASKVKPTWKINKEQRKIFRQLKDYYEEAGLLGEMDGYILTAAAVNIERLQRIDKRIEDDPDLLYDRDTCNTRKDYLTMYFRFCNELSLSPQARAKMGILIGQNRAKKDDPILTIFGGGDT